MQLNRLFIVGLIFLMFAFIGLGIIIQRQERNRVQANLRFQETTISFPGSSILSPHCWISLATEPATKSPNISTPQSTIESCLQYFVEVEAPSRMEVGGSEIIRVSLHRGSGSAKGTVEVPGNLAAVSSPIPNPYMFLKDESSGKLAFGVEYKPFAITSLDGVNFKIAPTFPPNQSFDQERIDWIWTISSDKSGEQWINISIAIEWRKTDDSSAALRTRYWREPFKIDVYEPIISGGQISLMSLISGLIGSGLSIPWLIEKINQRKKMPRKKTSRTKKI